MTRSAGIGAALAVLLTGCTGEPPLGTPLATARVAGDFRATTAVFTSATDPSTSFDVISENGQLRLNLGTDGRFVQDLVVPGRAVITRSGTALVAGNTITFSSDGLGTRTVPFVFGNDVLRFRDTGSAFDFDNTGELRPAILELRLVR